MASLGRRPPSRTDNAAPVGQTIVLTSETVIALSRSVCILMRVCVRQLRMKVT